MGSLSLWHLVIVILPLVIIGSIIGVAVWRSSKTNAAGEPVGFGGYENLMRLPNGLAIVYIEAAILLAFAAFQVVVAVAMYRKSRWFPTLFLYQWFAIALAGCTDPIIMWNPQTNEYVDCGSHWGSGVNAYTGDPCSEACVNTYLAQGWVRRSNELYFVVEGRRASERACSAPPAEAPQ